MSIYVTKRLEKGISFQIQMNDNGDVLRSICMSWEQRLCTYAGMVTKSRIQFLYHGIQNAGVFTMVLAHSNESDNEYLISSKNTISITTELA